MPATPLYNAHHGGLFFMHFYQRHFKKPALSVDEQLHFLIQQGLLIADKEQAAAALTTIGYYRFSGYALPFKQPHHPPGQHRCYKPNTTFEQIYHIYQFDKALRLLVSDAIETIEVAFRAVMGNEMATRYGTHWYVEQNHFSHLGQHQAFLTSIKKLVHDKAELFIKHYYANYEYPPLPPVWMVMESISFGSCSKLFSNIKRLADKKAISHFFHVHPTLLESWLMTLTYTRNLCAHHARLWNRWFVVTPILPKQYMAIHHRISATDPHFIRVAFIIIQLLKTINPNATWKVDLQLLFQHYPQVPIQSLGFIKEWQRDPFWEIA